ncbi:MAG: FecR domain-containing protein [Prolixibacteraceae bacterium]|nr:FecR domain-containing protein [Prolixibacteraceae bacterium]
MNSPQIKIIQHKNSRKEALAKFYKYAAIILITLLLGSAGFYVGFRNMIAPSSEIILTGNQVLDNFVLPDGTVVALNNNSKLSYPEKFSDVVREVTLSGEAFFDVTPNPKKPFVIHAGNAQVKVLGTSFNVRAYPKSEIVEVVVASGKVQVTGNSANVVRKKPTVYLVPGEKGTLSNENNKLKKSTNTDPNFLAWKTHNLVFEKIPLSQVVECLENIYHIKIRLKEPELNHLLLTAQFENKPVDFILNVLRLTFKLDLSEENELFILSSRTNK